MRRKSVAALAACAVVIFVFPAVAEAMGREGPPGRWWRMPEVADALELSQADKDSLDELYVQNRRGLIELKNDLERERFELENILEQQNLDEKAAMEQFKKIERCRERLSMERFRYFLQVRKMLGHERYQKLMTMIRDFHGKREKRGGLEDLPLPLNEQVRRRPDGSLPSAPRAG